MLDVSVLDAFIAGLSTAFFGALVAGGAYLLKGHVSLREEVIALQRRLNALAQAEDLVDGYAAAQLAKERLNRPGEASRGDADD